MNQLNLQEVIDRLSSLSSLTLPFELEQKLTEELRLTNRYLKQLYILLLISEYLRLGGHNSYARLSIILKSITDHICCTDLISIKDLEPLNYDLPVHETLFIVRGLADKVMKQTLMTMRESIVKRRVSEMFSTNFFSEN